MDAPSLQISSYDLQNLIRFIYTHEGLLNEFGAIKIQPNADCEFALKKRPKKLVLPPTNEHIVKIDGTESIYSVKRVDYNDKSPKKDSVVTNECSFWSSLASSSNKRLPLNISLASNTSFFYQKTSCLYFDIHRLPNQSLLKLTGSKIIQKFVPCVKRAHAPGAIFPITCAQQHLFTIDYHHEGGDHHWYIIPNCEREVLQRIFEQHKSSVCLDQGQVFIDPVVLDKYHIRYHRIIQHPNEFVVLAAGTLTQSFTQDASWSESIHFALPSWIEQGHARVPVPLCQCRMSHSFASKIIDTTRFTPELIQKYINTHLNNINQNKSAVLAVYDDMDIATTPQSDNNETNSLNVEQTPSINKNLVVSSVDRSSFSFISLFSDSATFEEDNYIINNNYNNLHTQYRLLEEGIFRTNSEWTTFDTAFIDSLSHEHLYDANMDTSQFQQITCTPTNNHQNAANSFNINNDYPSFEELMDLVSVVTDSVPSLHEYTDHSTDTASPPIALPSTQSTITVKLDHVKNEHVVNKKINNRKTLFVSGLNSNVNENDIRHYFPGCEKVTIKRYRTTPYLKYAFVAHRTFREARHNLNRFDRFHILGRDCIVEYARDCSPLASDHEDFEQKKVLVREIPKNVSQNHLHNLFGNCRVIEYQPARTVHFLNTTTTTTDNSKVLWGHVVLLFDDEQQAASVVEHARQYHINGQSLSVVLYRNKVH